MRLCITILLNERYLAHILQFCKELLAQRNNILARKPAYFKEENKDAFQTNV